MAGHYESRPIPGTEDPITGFPQFRDEWVEDPAPVAGDVLPFTGETANNGAPDIVNSGNSGTGSGGAISGGTSSTNNSNTTVAPIDYAAIDAMADEAVASGLMSQIDADLFKQIARQYSGSSVNYDSIIEAFNDIAENTIDPEFAERAKTFGADLLTQKKYMEDARAMELEQEGAIAKSNIETTQRNLENSGLTFSGAAVKELGGISAYGQVGTTVEGGVPTQIPLGGTFAEGEVNKTNRLMSTSSQARQAKAFQDLGRRAEDYLGQAGASVYGINYTPAGVSIGTNERDRIKARATILQNLYGNYQTDQNRSSTQLTQ